MLSTGDLFVLIAYYTVLVLLAVYGTHRMAMIVLYYRNRKRPPAPSGKLDPLPRVTVQLPIFNERYVVERLLDGVEAIAYPRDLLEVQILDDSTDDTRGIAEAAAERLRARGLDVRHLPRNCRSGFKAGALAAGMAAARAEFFLVLDADFVPDPTILRDSLDHFSDPKVGMVQTRWGHLNDGYSLLTRLQSIFLDGHFVIEHTARHRSGRFFNFNGTAGIWRRQAIEDAGGWRADTLTEDLDLSYRAQLAGWKFVYLKDLVSPAELPVDINGFKSQQHRWTKGSIETGRRLLPAVFGSREPAKVKIEAFFHLTNNLSYPLVVLLSLLVFPAMEIRHRIGWTRLIWLDFPLFFVSTISVLVFYLASQKEIDPAWPRKIRYLPMLLSLGIGLGVNNTQAVAEALLGRRSEFLRTPKYSLAAGSRRWSDKLYRSRVPLLSAVELLLAAYFAGAILLSIHERLYLALPFLLIFFNGYALVSAFTILQRLPERAGGAPARLRPAAAHPVQSSPNARRQR